MKRIFGRFVLLGLLHMGSTQAIGVHEARKLISQIDPKIASDISYSAHELLPVYKKPDFTDYYKSEVLPFHSSPSKHIADSAIHVTKDWQGNNLIIFWTEGISPSAWGGKEWIYTLSVDKDHKVKIEASRELELATRGVHKYKRSTFALYPNAGCGYNHFVVGLLSYLSFGGSGSTAYLVYIEHDKHTNQYTIEEVRSPVMMQPVPCMEH